MVKMRRSKLPQRTPSAGVKVAQKLCVCGVASQQLAQLETHVTKGSSPLTLPGGQDPEAGEPRDLR